jgi:hypothetical protein
MLFGGREQMNLRRTHPCILFLCLPAFALAQGLDKKQESDAKGLVAMKMTMQIDDACGFFSAEERQIYQVIFDTMLKKIELPPGVKDMIIDPKDQYKPNCQSKDAIAFVNIARHMITDIKSHAQAGGDGTGDQKPQIDCETQLKDLKLLLDRYFDSSPAGQLNGYDGCWIGPFNGSWQLRLCFSGRGSQTTVSLFRQDAKISCDYAGSSRPRQDGAFVVGFNQARACSDGTRTEHIEGMCSPLERGSTSTKCLFSIYACGNEFLVLDGGKTVGNESVTLQREDLKWPERWSVRIAGLWKDRPRSALALSATIVLLGFTIFYGYVRPFNFAPGMALRYASTITDLDDQIPSSLATVRGVRAGFYRNARACLRENLRIDGTAKDAGAILHAGRWRAVFVKPGSKTLYREIDGNEWQIVEAGGRKASLGEVYRIGDSGPFFQLAFQRQQGKEA